MLCRELVPLKPLICWPRCVLLTGWFLCGKWNLTAVQLKCLNFKASVAFWNATWKLSSSWSSSLPPAAVHSAIPMCLLQCRDALTTRQKLIAQDYKVSYSLAKSCKSDLKKYRCNVENLPRSREARLSYLLMCLESAVHRGKWSSIKRCVTCWDLDFKFLLDLQVQHIFTVPFSKFSFPNFGSEASFLIIMLSSLLFWRSE